ncbi:hypothetical protein ABZV34_09670 [Streptomyces sp. NPDC005195]|uniref:hypothetical protein n=1 Tax=Streptomyces sp. NPDC005195 TaxID=3154561 RepID=UPI0033A82641
MTPPPRGSGAAARLTASGPTAVRTDRDDFGGERFDGNRRDGNYRDGNYRDVNHRAAHRFDDSEGGR